MKFTRSLRLFLAAAGMLLILGTAQAQTVNVASDITPNQIFGSQGGVIPLPDNPFGQTFTCGGTGSDVVLVNLEIISGASSGTPDTISNGAYSILLTLTDPVTLAIANVTVTGTLSGSFSLTTSNVDNTFGPLPDPVTIGCTTYTFSDLVYAPPNPPGGLLGAITIHITCTPGPPPTITCPPDITVECLGDVPPPDTGSVGVTGCGTLNVEFVGEGFIGFCPTIITRTYKVTDELGRTAECTQTITVNDTTPPVLSGCPVTITLVFPCLSDVPPPPTVTATDNCDGTVDVVFSEVQSNPGSNCNNLITRTWTATDACGNTASCGQAIAVNDDIPPTVTCPANITVQGTGSPCQATVDFHATATDNCGGTITLLYEIVNPDGTFTTVSPPATFPVGTTTIRVTATDECGNSSQCTFTITVLPCFAGGRMTGGGSIFMGTTRITHGFELHCDITKLPNTLEINWLGTNPKVENNFHLTALTSATCIDDPAITPNPPNAGFDTFIGTGTGTLNGVSGYTIEFTFTDAGEPGTKDTATYLIKDSSGNVVLSATGKLTKGNHQAHNI